MDAVDKIPEFVRAKDFAEMTGLAMSTVYKHCRSGELPASMVCGVWYVAAREAFRRGSNIREGQCTCGKEENQWASV